MHLNLSMTAYVLPSENLCSGDASSGPLLDRSMTRL
jgi:hypothetical protein